MWRGGGPYLAAQGQRTFLLRRGVIQHAIFAGFERVLSPNSPDVLRAFRRRSPADSRCTLFRSARAPVRRHPSRFREVTFAKEPVSKGVMPRWSQFVTSSGFEFWLAFQAVINLRCQIGTSE